MKDVPAEPVFEIEDGVQFEWCRFAVYPHPAGVGRYATFWNSGCSCSFWEVPTLEEVRAAEPKTRADVRVVLAGFMDRNKAFISAGEAVRHLEEFEVAMNQAASA